MDYKRYMSFRSRIQAQALDKTQSIIKYPYAEVVEKEGKGGNPPVVILKSATSQERERVSKFGDYAIILRDRVNAKGETENPELEIQSETMQEALHSIFGAHSPASMRADPIVFRKPYYPLFHCRSEIRELAERKSNTPEQKRHLDWLVEFMSENLAGLEKIQEGLVDKGLVEYKHLPIIFEEGSIVVGQVDRSGEKGLKRERAEKNESPECFLFHGISDELEESTTGAKYVEVQALRWGYNGSMFGLTAESLRINEFSGSRKITELECFPLKYLKEEDRDKMVPELIERGRRWCDYVEAKTFSYKGVAHVPHRSTFCWDIKVIPKYLPGRVILDHLAFGEAFPELNRPLYNKAHKYGEDVGQRDVVSSDPTNAWKISSRRTVSREGLWRTSKKDGYIPTDAQALLCPASSPGYSLDQKDWGYFNIDLLRDVHWIPNPIDELEMDDIQKKNLKDLILDHYSKAWSNEIVPGKGEGLIFLLHGPPGCGKTLTAELMAEEGERALLRISCGDLGHRPHEIEKNLDALLKLALRGSAIVLIDEADTFLAKRSIGGGSGARDYFHNAIVSIFLKHLEYFRGVIFLTTNQETDFDEAVSSRVVRLRYGPLDAKGRAEIWKKLLLKGGTTQSKQAIVSLCEELGNDYELDGREIKNLAQLSLAISRRRSKEMSKDIVQQMYAMTHAA